MTAKGLNGTYSMLWPLFPRKCFKREVCLS